MIFFKSIFMDKFQIIFVNLKNDVFFWESDRQLFLQCLEPLVGIFLSKFASGTSVILSNHTIEWNEKIYLPRTK